jgi:hypothetical protein
VCVAVFVPASNETQGQRKNNETALECIPAVKGISREPEAKLCDSLLSSGGGGGQRLVMKHTGQLVKVDRAVDTAEGGYCSQGGGATGIQARRIFENYGVMGTFVAAKAR